MLLLLRWVLGPRQARAATADVGAADLDYECCGGCIAGVGRRVTEGVGDEGDLEHTELRWLLVLHRPRVTSPHPASQPAGPWALYPAESSPLHPAESWPLQPSPLLRPPSPPLPTSSTVPLLCDGNVIHLDPKLQLPPHHPATACLLLPACPCYCAYPCLHLPVSLPTSAPAPAPASLPAPAPLSALAPAPAGTSQRFC